MIKEYEIKIRQVCSSLANYGIKINSERLLMGDFSEFNDWKRKIEPIKEKDRIKIEIVNDFINVLRKYPGEEKVPLLDKSVKEVLTSLYEIKVQLDSDRAYNLFNILKNYIEKRRELIEANDYINKKIHELTKKNEELKEYDKIQQEYDQARQEYLELQTIKKEDVTELLFKLRQFSGIMGNLKDINNEIEKLENEKKLSELMKCKLQEELNLHREKVIKKPKFEEKYNELRTLFDDISRLREKIIQWIQILRDPSGARAQYTLEKHIFFGLEDYERFVKAVGQYLGNQFEPVAYDYKFYEIKFFDIEKDVFITKDDRRIPINKLSQGQSKITTLTGILKKMDSNRKKIILIDEIADLDPDNLNNLINRLLEEHKKGSVILAVLVRPPHEQISKPVEIRGWK